MSLEQSWVESANAPDHDFPIQNLPYGVFSPLDRPDAPPRCCVAIGDMALDLAAIEEAGLLRPGGARAVFAAPALNDFMALGPAAWEAARARLTDLLREGGARDLRDDAALRARALVPLSRARMHLPFRVAGYTDFYAGRQHAWNVGVMFRGPENALPPNWLHMPIGYNGRASTVVVSGTELRRPLGQLKGPDDAAPRLGPSERLDFELEMGAVVGVGNPMGRPVSVAEADEMIFGHVLLNDWSARDIQVWEYQPLGPFQAKAFATTISPWVVTRAALEPFRAPSPPREKPLLPYLHEPGPMLHDVRLEVALAPEGGEETVISRTSSRELYYSSAQQLAHHALCGCAMQTGDLLGTGTISGPERDSFGSLLELTWGGKEPLTLKGGARRAFLQDGDAVVMRGWAQGEGWRVGFGECAGRILPAPDFAG
ncbi:fumarylacetoacetase [Oceanicella actignis]|uniref:fumarylacetoacetase n=1 Tax=Oceanicella actignis TaxID=1189325 RepID=UPI0011E6CF78|nr:fumarylacetoacetase [Oceanicella actignis]TYO91479.1 fumarylacetoacetate hydrolase [Oceanicella actignis]